MGDFPEQNGVFLEESAGEVWARAEVAAQEIIGLVQPTAVSEERRKNVIDYVQGILKGCLGCEVFPFGSVPLKTYLPDGDIDLTAFCIFNSEGKVANDVYTVLETEDRNPAAKFIVKDVQYIQAEVKLVKCLVQNIVVDISFNQIGGLCTLCFLEEIDRLIGKNHLFKRSIILIKAWCYYESRILGAHHGLISTYALETLVLYIFHLFHSSLNGPLAVLHKFLDYFSKFDWENLCVSLTGPVHLSSFPEVVTEKPETSGRELLLSDDFMKECVRKFYVPSKEAEMNKTFTQKHLNIVDPLKENNNLGRSVSKGNFFRIRSAFSYGARKLGQILLQPEEIIAAEVRKFFTNTLDRHGTGQRPDVQEHLQLPNCNGFISEAHLRFDESYQDKNYTHDQDSSNNQLCESRVGSEDLKQAISNCREAETNLERNILENKKVLELSEELSASTSSLSGEAVELAASDIRDLRITERSDDFWPREKLSPSGLKYAPHLYFSQSLGDGKMENGYLDEDQHTDSSLTCDNIVVENTHHEVNGFMSWEHDSKQCAGTGRHDTKELSPYLSDYVDCHLNNLQYARWWYDQGSAMPMHQSPILQPNVSWNAMPQMVNVNGMVSSPTFLPSSPSADFVDEVLKPRGVGTFFPIPNHQSYMDRASPKGRYQGQLKSPRTNGRGPTPLDRIPQAQGTFRQGIGRPKFSYNHENFPVGQMYKQTNGFIQTPVKVFENGPPLSPPPESETRESDPSRGSEIVEPVFDVRDSRLSVNSYQLKDDEDFPPL